ncbi:EAL and HDOD domain-containing protein [Vibrio sonorensis]|uniref:EAL and HDOD domain-containing protein n=1 Tax=Vibrio sonorensis TaxID=1004316 RepID=UPI0008D9BAB8|nr:EAL domain-containing protein [Vibrio sonorensis]
MEKSFVARQPIVDCEEKLIGYELLFREGKNNAFPDIDPDKATSKVLLGVYFKNDSYDSILQDKVGFVNFPYKSIVKMVPALMPKSKIVVEILEDCPPTDELLQSVKKLKRLGYKIALDDFVPSPEWRSFLPYIDIIKFDISTVPLAKVAVLIKKLDKSKIQFVAERVETQEDFLNCKEIGFDYFQGYYFAKPELVEQKTISTSQVSILNLCKEVSKQEIDIKKLEEVFANDVGLSYKLFRYVNSTNISNPIRSFRQALAYLGSDKIRMFVSLVALSSDKNSAPEPIYQMSLQRACFCSLVAKELSLSRSDAYIVGLFSLLDSMFKVSFDTIFSSIKIDNSVRAAILNKQGALGVVLTLMEAYETADWMKINLINKQLNLCSENSGEYFTKSLNWNTPKAK